MKSLPHFLFSQMTPTKGAFPKSSSKLSPYHLRIGILWGRPLEINLGNQSAVSFQYIPIRSVDPRTRLIPIPRLSSWVPVQIKPEIGRSARPSFTRRWANRLSHSSDAPRMDISAGAPGFRAYRPPLRSARNLNPLGQMA